VLGRPRIGPRRELKRALERYWSGAADRAELLGVAAGLARADRAAMVAAGLDSVPVGTPLYDHVLDAAVLFGAVPDRFAGIGDDLDRAFAMARGTADVPPLEMTKWFDTNYHYLVPEIGHGTAFSLHADALLAEVVAAVAEGVPARPVVVGPVSFLLLAKAPLGETAAPLDRLDDLLPQYAALLSALAAAGATWVQLDEPALTLDVDDAVRAATRRSYDRLTSSGDRPAVLVATYFGDAGPVLQELLATRIDGVALDLVSGAVPDAGLDWAGRLVVAGVVDGRNIWRTDPDRALALLAAVRDRVGASVVVSSSCSLLHVPYRLEGEAGLDPQLRSWLAFADEKVAEVVDLATALTGVGVPALDEARAALADRRSTIRVHQPQVRSRVAGLREEAFRRGDEAHRRMVQGTRWELPPLPTTTIGSFPQTAAVRTARAELRAGTLGQRGYDARMKAEIAAVIALQEDIGLDVLVHGEPERNDMVQYFAEQLGGFATTAQGWVQSYGSRCVRPPVLYGDVHRTRAMTVTWSSYAQGLTAKPVKGMLTGPVTILAWSFVRDDQPLATTAFQVALAIRDETVDLQNAGIGIIQVDEPALRELLPPRRADRPAYLDWAVRAFRLATSGVSAATAVHTHLCYSEFGEIIDAIADLGADVTSVEAARSAMELLDDLARVGYTRGIGPGVYDIHSPRVPSVAEIRALVDRAVVAVDPRRLWVNPDCGLKTRTPAEVEPALRNMVAAAVAARSELTIRR
jgi:5-methyltetrahydropteroyltriglutamate--homocysteine methyltransferase